MKRFLTVAVVLLACAVLLGAVGTSVSAQTDPDPGLTPVRYVPQWCLVGQYDLDGDGRLTSNDMDTWKIKFKNAGCKLGDEAGPEGCPAELDLDGDGFVTRADVDDLFNHYWHCSWWKVGGIDLRP